MQDLKTFYKKYSSILIPGVFVLCAFFLFLQVVLPALSALNSARANLSSEQKKLSSYNESIAMLQRTEESQLSYDVGVVTAALPPSKDVQATYLALTESAAASGVTLSGFSVVVGDIYGKSDAKSPTSATSEPTPFMSTNITLSGVNIQSLTQFMSQLQKSAPLSRVTGFSITDGQGTMGINFYYKPYDLSVINSNVVSQLTANQQQLLKSLPQE